MNVSYRSLMKSLELADLVSLSINEQLRRPPILPNNEIDLSVPAIQFLKLTTSLLPSVKSFSETTRSFMSLEAT